MGLMKLLIAPVRRVVNFPLFQLTVAIRCCIAAGCRQRIGRFANHLPCEGRHHWSRFFRGSPRGGGQKLCQVQPGMAPPQKSAALSNTQPKEPALLGAKNIPPD
jgi:hypothetical protein